MVGQDHQRALRPRVAGRGEHVERAPALGHQAAPQPRSVGHVVDEQAGGQQGGQRGEDTGPAGMGERPGHDPGDAERKQHMGVAVEELHRLDVDAEPGALHAVGEPARGLVLTRGARPPREHGERIDDIAQGQLGLQRDPVHVRRHPISVTEPGPGPLAADVVSATPPVGDLNTARGVRAQP